MSTCLNILTLLFFTMKKIDLDQLPKDWRDVSRVFTALGDPHRQRILLMFEPGERLNAGAIAENSKDKLSRPAVMHHLKLLVDAGVLIREKKGREAFYRIDRGWIAGQVGKVLDYIEQQT